MTGIYLTIALAFFVILIALALLAIGYLITGSPKITPGACGRDPTKRADDPSCGSKISCGLCKKEKEG